MLPNWRSRFYHRVTLDTVHCNNRSGCARVYVEGKSGTFLGDHPPDPDHLVAPLLGAHGLPVGLVVAVGDGVGRHLVPPVPVLVHQRVVRVALVQHAGQSDGRRGYSIVGNPLLPIIQLTVTAASSPMVETQD